MFADELVRCEGIELAGVPCLICKATAGVKTQPTVILYHGWSGKKESREFLASILALHGYQVIVPDAVDHGERGSLNYSEDLPYHFWRVVIESVRESAAFLKAAVEELQVDLKRTALVGESMGGFIASGVFALHPELRCLVNLNGACAWKNVEQTFIEVDGSGLALPEQWEDILELDPLKRRDTFAPRPVLMLHGERDSLIPLKTQRYFFNVMVPLYREHMERLKLVEIARLDHHVTVGMLDEAVNWLKRWLPCEEERRLEDC